jgi:hypothetical protein
MAPDVPATLTVIAAALTSERRIVRHRSQEHRDPPFPPSGTPHLRGLLRQQTDGLPQLPPCACGY